MSVTTLMNYDQLARLHGIKNKKHKDKEKREATVHAVLWKQRSGT